MGITKKQALDGLRTMQYTIQKVRSDTVEFLEAAEERPVAPEELADLNPWLFGDRCPLEALTKLIDRAETEGVLQATDVYNMATILHRWLPTCRYMGETFRPATALPEPEIAWVLGFTEPEVANG